MGYQHWKYETLHAFCMEAFEKFGFTEAEANIIQDVLLTSDLYGIESHGMQRMVRYHKCIEKGMIHVDAKPEVVFETPVSAVIDGHDGMGQLIGHKAMTLAIEKAKQSGVGIVSVRNSNHYGIAGYYAKMACREGLIGFSCTNSEAIMVPTNGRLAMLGSNPIACAMPAEPYDFFFDASTTVVTRRKSRCRRAGRLIRTDTPPPTRPMCWQTLSPKTAAALCRSAGVRSSLAVTRATAMGCSARFSRPVSRWARLQTTA